MIVERVLSFALATIIIGYESSMLAMGGDWKRLPISLAVTILAIGVVKGPARALEEIKSVLADFKDVARFFCSFGLWPNLSTEIRPLAHAAQCLSLFTGYSFSYGLYSYTFSFPISYAHTFGQHWWKYPAHRREYEYMVFCKACPLAVLLCSLAHISSHRYFSHKSFKTSRVFRAVLAVLATFSGQRGALWWASRHRLHHRNCGRDGDPHSAKALGGGLLAEAYAQIGWTIDRRHFAIALDEVRDWDATELLFIECIWSLLNMGTKLVMSKLFGNAVMLFSFAISMQFEGLINSWCHTARDSGDSKDCDSLDSFIVALLTGGEGFHYGHHKDPLQACHGWRWGWLKYCDAVYSTICILEKLGVVWDVRHPTAKHLETAKQGKAVEEKKES